MKSQNDQIREYLLSGHKITSLVARFRFRCDRLSARIGELRKRGMDIKTEMIKVDGGKYVGEYSI